MFRVHMGSSLGYLRTSIFGLKGSHWLRSGLGYSGRLSSSSSTILATLLLAGMDTTCFRTRSWGNGQEDTVVFVTNSGSHFKSDPYVFQLNQFTHMNIVRNSSVCISLLLCIYLQLKIIFSKWFTFFSKLINRPEVSLCVHYAFYLQLSTI